VSFVVLDTDVASGAFRDTLPGRLRVHLASQTACITFVTIGELTKWTAIRSWGPQRRSQLEQWRRRLVLLPFDEQVAVIWGELQARAQQRGRPRPANDTWIAACCLANELPLATFNTKDFADFAAFDGLGLIDVT
jgi:predicted nucleic acid-binding protein